MGLIHLAEYVCYVDKEASTFFNTKLRDKKTNKRVVVKSMSPGRRLAYLYFSLMASADKGITERDGKIEIIIGGTVKKETRSAIVVNIDGKDSKYEKHKIKNT